MHKGCFFLLLLLACVSARGEERLPIIDMHLHALPADGQGPPPLAMCTPVKVPAWDPAQPYGALFGKIAKQPNCEDPVWSPETDQEVLTQTLEIMQRRNIIGVLSGSPDFVRQWMSAAPDRFMPGIDLQMDGAREYTPSTLRDLHSEGRLSVLAEITNQYVGVAPSDERMNPYWQLAQELELPVGIHVGTGPPGAIYLGFNKYRAHMHSALSIEEVLINYPKLRIYLMHAGYPLLDDLLAVMYAHPQVHVDIGVIVYMLPRIEFYRYLKSITDAGYGDRVLFGSDQMVWPGTIDRAIEVIEEAPFLSQLQKRDILYNNAARFLRLSKEDIARHHRM